MESKYVIGLSLQRFEGKHIQEFGLVAAQKRNVETHAWSFVTSADTNFSNRSVKKRSAYLLRSRYGFSSALGSNVSIAPVVIKCN